MNRMIPKVGVTLAALFVLNTASMAQERKDPPKGISKHQYDSVSTKVQGMYPAMRFSWEWMNKDTTYISATYALDLYKKGGRAILKQNGEGRFSKRDNDWINGKEIEYSFNVLRGEHQALDNYHTSLSVSYRNNSYSVDQEFDPEHSALPVSYLFCADGNVNSDVNHRGNFWIYRVNANDQTKATYKKIDQAAKLGQWRKMKRTIKRWAKEGEHDANNIVPRETFSPARPNGNKHALVAPGK